MTSNQGPEPTMDRLPTPAPGDAPAAESFHDFPPPGDAPATAEARSPVGLAMPGRGGLAPQPRRRGRASSGLVLVGAMLVAIAGVAFAAGRTTAPASTASTAGGFGNGAAGPRASGDVGQAGGGGSISLSGTVVDVTSDHLTLELASGQTVQVALDFEHGVPRPDGRVGYGPGPGRERHRARGRRRHNRVGQPSRSPAERGGFRRSGRLGKRVADIHRPGRDDHRELSSGGERMPRRTGPSAGGGPALLPVAAGRGCSPGAPSRETRTASTTRPWHDSAR